MSKPDWEFWGRMAWIEVWQAAALSIDIEPDEMKRKIDPQGHKISFEGQPYFLDSAFPSEDVKELYDKRLRLLKADLNNSVFVSQGSRDSFKRLGFNTVKPSEFAAWCVTMRLEIPQELARLVTPKSLSADEFPSKNPEFISSDAASSKTINDEPSVPAGILKSEASRKSGSQMMKKSVLLKELSRYDKLGASLQANELEFKNCRVPNDLAPGGKGGFYYLELVEKICASRWGVSDRAAPPLKIGGQPPAVSGIRNGIKFGR